MKLPGIHLVTFILFLNIFISRYDSTEPSMLLRGNMTKFKYFQMLISLLIFCLVTEPQKTSLGFEPTADIRGCFLCSCNLPVKTNASGPDTDGLSCSVSEVQKQLHWPRIQKFLELVTFAPTISLPKQITFVVAPFF